MKSRVIRGVITGVVMFIIIFLIDHSNMINTKDISKILIIGGVIFFFIKILPSIKRQKNIIQILKVEKDAPRYIAEIQKLIGETKNTQSKNILTISLACGYAENYEYNKAFELMSSVDPKTLMIKSQVYYYLDLAVFKFNVGEVEEAVAIMKKKEILFKQFEKHPTLGYYIAINKSYQYSEENEINKAKEHLDKAGKFSNIPHMKDEIDLMKATILMKENCIDEAHKIIKRLKETKQTPNFQNNLKRLEESK